MFAGVKAGDLMESDLLTSLAQAQRMNTDVRRKIFCVVMGGNDALDAFEKLLKLNLRDKQEPEIPRVIIDCCCQVGASCVSCRHVLGTLL